MNQARGIRDFDWAMFAVTLVIGLFANVFTAVWVSRVIFDWGLSRKRVEALSI